MYQKKFPIAVTFVTKMGVRVRRTVTLTDTSRSKAEARALKVGVPQGATEVGLAK